MRLVALVAAPYWYVRHRLAGGKECPSGYFIRLLSEGRGKCAEPILLIMVLSIAARSFDAGMASRAAGRLRFPIRLWSLSARDIGLLLEAAPWHGAIDAYAALRDEILRRSDASAKVRDTLAFYDAFARGTLDPTDAVRARIVLPALFWDKAAAKAFAAGRFGESVDALHRALRFVPADDPRRPELVARHFHAQALLDGRAGP